MEDDLREAVNQWIKVEWAFRFGPKPYTARLQEILIKAEENLRKVATGCSDIVEAAGLLGANVTGQPSIQEANPYQNQSNQQASSRDKVTSVTSNNNESLSPQPQKQDSPPKLIRKQILFKGFDFGG